MANKIKIARGLKTNIPMLSRGELAYATDTNELFIGVLANPESTEDNVLINDLDLQAELTTGGDIDVAIQTKIQSSVGVGLLYNEQDDLLDIKFATTEEAQAGVLDNVVMSSERTKQAIQSIAIDGGAWVSPVIEFTNIGLDEVSFTIENQEDYEVDVKYELSSPPTENSVTLAANTTSSVITLSDLNEGTNYVLYVQSFLGNDAISEIIGYSFTTGAPDDPTGSPGPLFFVQGAFAEPNQGFEELGPVGFFGQVSAGEFLGTDDWTDVMSELGIDQGTAQFESGQDISPVLKFRHNNKIKFITQKIIRNSISWDHIASKINVYGGAPITLNGVNYKARLMKGWGQVSGSDDSVTTPNYVNGPIYTVNYSFGMGLEGGNSGVNWPTDNSDWSASNPNEWNTLIFPIHEKGKYDINASSGQNATPNVPNWAGYSDSDLDTVGGETGLMAWMQETLDTYTYRRVLRPFIGIAGVTAGSSDDSAFFYGLRLVFEIDVPEATKFFPAEVTN